MITVLVVVIVLLLVVLGAGSAVYVRRGQVGGPNRRDAKIGEAGANGAHVDAAGSTGTAVAEKAVAEPPSTGTAVDEARGTGTAVDEAGGTGTGSTSGTTALERPPGIDQVPPEPAGIEPALLPSDEAALADLLEGIVPPSDEGVRAVRPRLVDRLGRARELLRAPLVAIRGGARVDETTFEDLEEALLVADVGLPTTTRLLDDLRARVRSGEIAARPEALIDALKADVVGLFSDEDRDLELAATAPSVWLFVGVNGVGKTTTIGKLAAREVAAGRSVVLAAGDTFRAAAGEQLSLWAERSGAGIVRGADGADPSSVVFDAVQHAAARGASLVLADTAGRLHTKVNLMDELRKVRRIAGRPPGTVTEVLLVLDATTGQNGLVQAREFADAVEVTGIVLTKLDGTAKGGIVLAIRSELGLPIKLVGLGEAVGDLVPFDPEEFTEALFS